MTSPDDGRMIEANGDGDLGQAIEGLSRPGALTASLNWYRANLAPRMPGPMGAVPALPPVAAPTLGIWSTGDHYRRRADEGLGGIRPGAVAVRGDPRRATGSRSTRPAG
jgi:hypothetical protein